MEISVPVVMLKLETIAHVLSDAVTLRLNQLKGNFPNVHLQVPRCSDFLDTARRAINGVEDYSEEDVRKQFNLPVMRKGYCIINEGKVPVYDPWEERVSVNGGNPIMILYNQRSIPEDPWYRRLFF